MKSSYRFQLALIFSMVLYMIFPAGTALAAPPGIHYEVIKLTTTVVGNTATITGTAAATPYKAQLDQQHFEIDWNDGYPPENFDDKYIIAANDSGGNLSFNWSESHVYADGVYTAYVKLYHQNSQGAEASAEAEITIAVNKGTITVIKEVLNDDGGTAVAGDFTLTVQGGDGATQPFPGSETGTTVFVTPGNFSVDEFEPNGYAISFFGDCSGTIAGGEFKKCTISNDDPEVTPRISDPAHYQVCRQQQRRNSSGGRFYDKRDWNGRIAAIFSRLGIGYYYYSDTRFIQYR